MSRNLEKPSPCKVNLLLNILGKRADGFHTLETVMHPVPVYDHLTFQRGGAGIALSCSDASLATDSRNLVYRSAAAFLEAAGIREGVRVHLQKNIPLAAGLGGGSGNAATTLLGLNELFGNPLPTDRLFPLAAALGSDIPFFLQARPALATGRGEQVQPLDFFPALEGAALFLVHPGFGIPTAWAYQHLSRFPAALNGAPGRAERLVSALRAGNLQLGAAEFYNSLEAPALDKYPILSLFQEFLRANGALATLMSGSGSTTFAIARDLASVQALAEKFRAHFGPHNWIATVAVR